MVWRTVLGTHPTGEIGLFISKPGVDAVANDPYNRSAWMFSSAIDKQANFLQSGRCNLNDAVYHPDIGSVPFVWFDLYDPAYSLAQEAQTASDGNSAYTIYRASHPATNYFQIIRQGGQISPPAGAYFRYIVFNLSQDG